MHYFSLLSLSNAVISILAILFLKLSVGRPLLTIFFTSIVIAVKCSHCKWDSVTGPQVTSTNVNHFSNKHC